MDDLSSANIYGHMADTASIAVEYKVTGLKRVGADSSTVS